MKKSFIIFTLILLSNFSNAQTTNSNIEKSVTGIQAGFLGVDLYNESKIAENFVLRSEINLYAGIWGGSMYEKTGFILYPSLNLQPKFYYNIDKRAKKRKNIKNNGANYISLQTRYTPNWFAISNYDNINLSNQISFVPTFGIRRNFGGNFNYEFKVGYGYGFSFGEKKNTSGGYFDLGFKVGYDF